jgi:hypothetical protein
MKKIITLSLVLIGFNTNAATISFEGKSYECESKQDVMPVFHCKKDNLDVLVVNAGYGYTGYYKNPNGKFETVMATKVVEGEKTLFEVPSYPGFGGMMGGTGMMPSFTPPDTLVNRKMTASMIATNLKDFSDPLAKSLVESANDFLSKSSKPKKIKVVANGNSEFICEPGETRKLTPEEIELEKRYNTKVSCNYYSCVDRDGNEALANMPLDANTFSSPNILTFSPKGKEQVLWSDLKVTSADKDDNDLVIYETNGFGSMGTPAYPQAQDKQMKQKIQAQLYSNADKVDDLDYLPTKIKDRLDLFKSFAAPGAAETMNYYSSLCSDEKNLKLIQKQKAIVDEMNDSVINENLSHLLSVVNGQVVGTLMPTDNIGKYGCVYQGMVVTPKALAHLNYIKRLNEKPNEANYLTLDEAQELFKKAASMEDIPFGYKYDGCYARAHVMARRFEAMGVPTEKVWIKGDLSVPGTDIRWNFHVAPVITVKDPVDGKPKKYVIDPSLLDKAVPLDDWVNTMKPNVKGPIVKTSYPFPVNAAMMERTAVALSSSEPYLPMEAMNTTEEAKMEMARKTMAEYSKLVKTRK